MCVQELETITREWDDFISQVKRTRKPYLDFLGGDRSKVSGGKKTCMQVVSGEAISSRLVCA